MSFTLGHQLKQHSRHYTFNVLLASLEDSMLLFNQDVKANRRTMHLSTISTIFLIAMSHGFRMQPRIINGDIARAIDFPFFVPLQSELGLCGGTLLSDR